MKHHLAPLLLALACTPFAVSAAEPKLCTKEYMPVCGVDGVTYGNRCTAGDVPIAHAGACNTAPITLPTPIAKPIGLANPASVNCIALGGKLAMRENAQGQYGMCTLPTGITCEEWALFRGECPKVVKPSMRTITRVTKTQKITVKYPVLRQKAIDVASKTFVDAAIAKLPKEVYAHSYKNTLFITSAVSRLANRYATVQFTTYTYTGGAHGGTEVSGPTYDLLTGKSLGLSELFVEGADYLTRISELARPMLVEHMVKNGATFDDDFTKNWLASGTKATEDNYKTFRVTKDGLVFTFAQYQVGPYVYGMPEVTVPWSELKDILTLELLKLVS